jgi:hypothetical protein
VAEKTAGSFFRRIEIGKIDGGSWAVHVHRESSCCVSFGIIWPKK